MSTDIVGAVVAVYEIVGPGLFRQCGYIVSCNSHVSALNREIKNLRDASHRLRHQVDLAQSVGDIIEHDVWTWLSDAEELIKSKNLILEKRVVSCCFGFVPNPRTRYVLGRRANKSLPELRALMERGKFDQVSYHPPAELVQELKVRSATSSSTVRYVELKSRALILKRIMADLNDHNKVGVYGMGGVGKTTLLRDVEKRARESGKFDDVVSVFVSQAPNIECIKSKILNKMGSLRSNEANKKTLLILLDDLWSKLKVVESIESSGEVKVKWVMTSRKQELLANDMKCYPTISLGVLEEQEVWGFFGELVNNKKVEDMKNNLAVASLLKKCAGLPVSIEALATVLEKKGLSSSDLVNADVLKLGKELINGSASLELSYNYLGDTDTANLAKSLFRIIGLLGTPTVPILTLLKYTVGLGLLSSSSSNNNTMERARRQVSTSLRMLQDASLLLESDDSDYVKIHDVVRDVAASIASRDDHALIFEGEDSLKGWSNDDIPKLNEEPEVAQDLGLLGSNSCNNNIMEKARRHVIITSSLHMLQDASLLLGSDNINYVKIHDIIRDVAASMASRDDHALVCDRDTDGLIRGWSKEKLKKSKSIYLPYSAIPKINGGWECPELSIVIMEAGDHVSSRRNEGRSHVELPSSFYKGMTKLKVIDFRNARFCPSPFSTQSDLRNLTTLFLHFCCIENISVIGKLESLQILSFVGSDLAHLPKEIGDLAKLRMLDLSQCSYLKTIEPGTLKRLTRLEELYIKESFDGWEVEEVEKPSNSSLAELNHLPKLRTLEVSIPNTDTLPLSLPLGDLVRYKVLIGDSWDWSSAIEYRESRTLQFKENSKNILNEDWLQSALQTTQDLYLDGLSGTGGSFHEQCKEGFKELKHLHLQKSSLIECIIWSTEWLECSAFTALESMILEKMESLEKICDGRISLSSFSKLKVVRVHVCHKLKSLFNLTLLKNLRELEEIEIGDCEMVQQIVIAEQIDDGDDDDDAAMSSRCSNIFFDRSAKRPMPNNAKEDYEIKKLLGNLRYLTLTTLPEITSFFSPAKGGLNDESMAAPVFFNDDQKVSQQTPKYKEIWSTTHLRLDKLQRIELTECKNVVHFTNYQVLLKLVNLESLTIAGCDSLEDIFDLQGIEPDVEILPKLYELKLRKLWKLKHIWKKSPKQQIKGCRKLRKVEIYSCYSLLYFSNSFMCEFMENLTEINVGSCDKMESVFVEEEGRESNASSVKAPLKSLKILVISDCGKLKTFISKCNNKGMAYWCYGEEVVDTSNSFFNEKVFLPSLESLILSKLGEFEKLWCGEEPSDQSYCNLQYLHVMYCGELQTVIPASLIERLHNLKQLWVISCYKLEVVFDLDVVGWNNTKKKLKTALILPQLQQVQLILLKNLRHVISERGSDNAEIVVGFPSLNRLEVYKCDKLINLISTTTATTLLDLDSLHITRCSGLLEVIGGGDEGSERKYKRNAIIFPHLTSLSLTELESLTCFSSEIHRFDFTCLTILKIHLCKSLKNFTKPKPDGHPGSSQDEAYTATQVLFSEKVQFPNLEELYISGSEVVKKLWNELPTTSSFCKLKLLEVSGCSSLQNVIPSFMVKRLQNLERLCISSCYSLQDIFKIISSTKQIESTSHDQSRVIEQRSIAELESVGKISRPQIHERINIVFTKLTCLELKGRIKLSNMWSGSYTLEIPSLKKLVLNGTNRAAVETIMEKVHLQNLEELEVSSLKIAEVWRIEPVYVDSFNKLKRLQVEECRGLVKIIPIFMLKRLHNLEALKVKECNKLEIVCELNWSIDSESMISKLLLPCFPFQKLVSIHVEKCECLRSLFSIISVGQHNLDQYEETVEDSIVQLPQLTYLKLEYLPKFSCLLFQQAGQYVLELPLLKEFFLVEAGDTETVTHKVALPERFEIQLTYFFGSAAIVLSDIVKALQTTQACIIGLLGSMGYDMQEELKQRVVVNEEEVNDLFDQVVSYVGGTAGDIQERLGIELGFVYGEAEAQGRAERTRECLLSYIRNKRLLLIFTGLSEDHEGLLEAAGIPSPLDKGVDPKHFKIILISEDNNKELLHKMGAKLPILPIGRNVDDRWMIFRQELRENSRQKQEEEVGLFEDINTDDEICCFVGPTTIVLNNIMAALRSNNQIIGILGLSSWESRKFSVSVGCLLKEENLIDEILVDSSFFSLSVVTIQEKLKRMLGITSTSTSSSSETTAYEVIRQTLISKTSSSRLFLVLPFLDEEVDLEAVGIPPLHQVDPKFLKIIITSKKRQVLQNMGAQQVFEIESGDHFFCRIVNGYLGKSDVKKLADECGSDDLAKLLAKKLKTQGMHAWANAFQRLNESPFKYSERKKVIDSL